VCCDIFKSVFGSFGVLKKQWPAFVLAFVLPLLAVFWWWGGFNAVSVTETEAGPYRYAYLDYEGPISNMRKPQREVLEKFTQSQVVPGDTINLILTDPRATHGKVRAQVGYTLSESATIPAGLKEGRIPRRPVYVAEVHAVVLLAPSKAYQKLADTLESQGKGLTMPTVELYRPAGQSNRVGHFRLEMNR
jgi:effector-binding domain-containing protein